MSRNHLVQRIRDDPGCAGALQPRDQLAFLFVFENHFNRDWIEAQLAHAEGTVRSIYNAAEWLSGRREMMAWWSDYLLDAARGDRRAA